MTMPEAHEQMAPRCPRCDEQHDDDPLKCGMVRFVEFTEYGAVKRIEFHGLAGFHTPTSTRRDGPVEYCLVLVPYADLAKMKAQADVRGMPSMYAIDDAGLVHVWPTPSGMP
jgi:hypothetical protein